MLSMHVRVVLAILILSISGFTSSSYGLNPEGLSLISWLSTFNTSASYPFFSSWDPSAQDPCLWAFINCSNDGLVSEIRIQSISLSTSFLMHILNFTSLTTLVLHDANITGEIPYSIANLKSLVKLDLSYNKLHGNIPKDIGKLPQLRFLFLSSNLLHGPIPEELSNCSQLREVEIVDNQLWGKIPAELGMLSNLEVFRAGGNAGIYGEIPANLSNCRELVFLGIANTAISGQIPSSLGQLKKLRTLSVYTSNLSGSIPPEISNCSVVEDIFLFQNQLIGEIPPEVGFLNNLERVLLWKNGLVGSIPQSLGNCTNLRVLDVSLNALTGEIPSSLSNLNQLEVLLLSYNNISGNFPQFIGNLSIIKQLELDNNKLKGEIPTGIGQLEQLTQFFAWQNQLHGSLPEEIGNCKKLQSLDLSCNFFTGLLPSSLFRINSLSKLMLISNGFSGDLPPAIANCTSLVRLRLGTNQFTGHIPPELGLVKSLNFLELSENQLSGEIPPEIGNCTQLEMLDLHENNIQGIIPPSIESLVHLNVLDLSGNELSGQVPDVLGRLTTLNKLTINRNYITGFIPNSIAMCKNLEYLDMSSNRLTGSIPDQIGQLQGLDIVLNLSWNSLSGPLPKGIANLSKLGSLDISHNMLTGSLLVLSQLDNLVALDVSYNNFSGNLPDASFFQDLPRRAFAGNPRLCMNGSKCSATSYQRHNSTRRLVLSLVVGITVLVIFSVFFGLLLILRSPRTVTENKNEEDNAWEWDITPFQKLSFTFNDVVKGLLESNVIGEGSSSTVYRVQTDTGIPIAVKKLSSDKKIGEPVYRDYFTAEVKILGSIRHKNIVRLLGCGSRRNSSVRLLMFDYMCNGSLDKLLYERKVFLDWNSRYKIVLGVAEGLAYLHHGCNPPIIHRDIKSNNILIGRQFEPYIADFGLAKFLSHSEHRKSFSVVAGSFGYIAPEYSYTLNITEKSDVYSYGVLLLEILTGFRPSDAQIPGGSHIVDWVRREHGRGNSNAASLLDDQLLKHTDLEVQETIQVLGIAVLCVNPAPDQRPSMKDVAAMLKEIRLEYQILTEEEIRISKTGDCSSYPRSSEPLITSPSLISCCQSPV